MSRKCPRCGGKLRSNGHCRRCDGSPARQASAAAVAQRTETAKGEPGDLEADLRRAVGEWDERCRVTTYSTERSYLKLAKVVAALLSHQTGFDKYGLRWLEEAIDPTLARANSVFGAACPDLERVSVFRNRAAAQLTQAIRPAPQAPSVPVSRPASDAPVKPAILARAPKPDEVIRQVRSIISECTGEERFSPVQFRPPEALRSETRLADCFRYWDISCEDVLARIETAFNILAPVDLTVSYPGWRDEGMWKTIGHVEEFVIATLEFQTTAALPDVTPARASVKSDQFTADEFLKEGSLRLGPETAICSRTVKLVVNERAWVSGICAKRLRNQLSQQLPGWRILISTRHDGLVNLYAYHHQNGESIRYDLLVTLDDTSKYRDYRHRTEYDFPKPCDGHHHRAVLKLTQDHPSRDAGDAFATGCGWGVLLGLAAVGGLWALVTFSDVSWPWLDRGPRLLFSGEIPWQNALGAVAAVCGLVGLVFAFIASIRCAVWNSQMRRKWDQAADQRNLWQWAVAKLDVAAALGVPVFECPNRFLRRKG